MKDSDSIRQMIPTPRRKPGDHVEGDNTFCRRTKACEAGRGRCRGSTAGEKNDNSSLSSGDGRRKNDLFRPRQHLGRGHSLSVLESRLEKIHNLSRCAESRHSWQSVRIPLRQMRWLKHVENTWRNFTTVNDSVIKVGPLTRRWVDT